MKKAGYFVFALFALSVLLIGSVAAAETDATTNVENYWDKITSSISSFFSNIFSGADEQLFEPSDFVLKLLIFFLVAVVLFSVSPFLPFIGDNKYITWIVTLLVAYLSTYSIKVEEIKLLLASYGALAMVITGIIPFFAIAAISKTTYDRGKPSLVSKAIWSLFIAFFLYKWFTFRGPGLPGMTVALIVAAAIMLLGDTVLWKLLGKSQARAGARSSSSANSVVMRRRLLEDLRDAEAQLVNLAHQKGKEKEMAELTDEIARLKGLIAGSKSPLYD